MQAFLPCIMVNIAGAGHWAASTWILCFWNVPEPLAQTYGNPGLYVLLAEVPASSGANWPPLILHSQSSMRMGLEEHNSVLDADAELRWVKRLFITDNSALANSLGGPNPTLTTQAVATRTAEKIIEKYFGGEAWVGRENPVSSIDDRVTAAVIERGL